MQETPVRFPGREVPLEKGQDTHSRFLGFSDGSDSKEFTCNAGDLGSIPELRRSPGGGGHDNPLQYSCLENPHGQRNLAGYSPWGCRELDTTEWLSTHTHTHTKITHHIQVGFISGSEGWVNITQINQREPAHQERKRLHHIIVSTDAGKHFIQLSIHSS